MNNNKDAEETSRSTAVDELSSVWRYKTSKKEKSTFDFAPWKTKLRGELDFMLNRLQCSDLHKHTPAKCSCMAAIGQVITEPEKDLVIDYLIKFAVLERDSKQQIVAEWQKYAGAALGRPIGEKYLLPGSTVHRVCQHAISELIGFGRKRWMSIARAVSADVDLPTHGLKGKPSNQRDEGLDDVMHTFRSLQRWNRWVHQEQRG